MWVMFGNLEGVDKLFTTDEEVNSGGTLTMGDCLSRRE